ncbi:ATP-binding protein [Crocosphaera sp. XPORK-15E]|uniref:hybrid sensor histidine kinase/response regulator n=1 Tax=Crocosphaera sp. XPORK-15E TaxID=3110247 RepID=UPI002B220274|nr:ATP-binding protein [Crocosphaera sp. XPORK-15E]MEA5536551.1 ATP-binding protein [Crocosphaera sp. XPORK-15E]
MNSIGQQNPKLKKSLIQKITQKIVLLSVISLLGIVNTIFLSSLFMTKKIEWTMEQISEQKIDTFKLFFTTLTIDLLRNRVVSARTSKKEKQELLRQIRWRNPSILDVLLVENNGTVIAQSSRSFRYNITKLEQQPWLSKLKEITQVWFGSVEYDRNTYSVTMAVKVTDELGIPIENLTLVARIDLTELWRKLVETKIGTTNIYITDESNDKKRIIVHRDIRLLNTEISSHDSILKNIGKLTIEQSPNQQLVIAYHEAFEISLSDQWIEPLNNVIWVTTIEEPFSEAILPFVPLILTFTLVLIIVIIIVISIIKFIKNRVIKPINNLQKAVISLNNNQFNQPIAIENDDELGELAKAFNQMAKQLKESFETLETRVKQRTLELEKANQAKQEFLSKMNHELRTPLNLILGYTERLNQDKSLNNEQKKELEIINRSGEHLLSLINEILDISKIEAGQIELKENSFDLYQLLDKIKEMFDLTAQSKGLNLILENRLNNDCHYIYADEGKLRQVLINLLSNAIKFTKKGTITLRANSLNNNAHELQFIQLEIEDTGQGIYPEEINKLFNAFEQTKSSINTQIGTGLGLYISRQFVELMGGKITVTSELNQGTIFTIELPIKLSQAGAIFPQAIEYKVIGLAPNQPLYRILVVDDHVASRQFLANLLLSVGLSVQTATNGQEALDLWQKWQPHLIWMDLEMSIMDGCEATKRIKKTAEEHSCYILALTADFSETRRTMALSCGCDDFVGKPFRTKVIWEKMSEYLGLQYIYEPLKMTVDHSGQQEEASSILTAESLKAMPTDWLEQLYQGSLYLNGKQVLSLIEQVSLSHPVLAKSLKELAETYQFARITELIDSHHSESKQ